MKFRVGDIVQVTATTGLVRYKMLGRFKSVLVTNKYEAPNLAWQRNWVGTDAFNSDVFQRAWKTELVSGPIKTKLGKVLYK